MNRTSISLLYTIIKTHCVINDPTIVRLLISEDLSKRDKVNRNIGRESESLIIK